MSSPKVSRLWVVVKAANCITSLAAFTSRPFSLILDHVNAVILPPSTVNFDFFSSFNACLEVPTAF
jgi:hypothetical protein